MSAFKHLVHVRGPGNVPHRHQRTSVYFPERVGMKALKRREEDQQECHGINKAQGKVSCAKKGPKVMGTNQGAHLLQVNLLIYISTSVMLLRGQQNQRTNIHRLGSLGKTLM